MLFDKEFYLEILAIILKIIITLVLFIYHIIATMVVKDYWKTLSDKDKQDVFAVYATAFLLGIFWLCVYGTAQLMVVS